MSNDAHGTIEFDIVIPTPKGSIFACKFVRLAELSAVSADSGVKMSIGKAHCLLGHLHVEATL